MSKRTRIHPVQFYLNDDEQYILEEKYRLSRMKSKSAFLRKMILYGFVYEVDYSHIRKMNTLLGNISSNLNQITRIYIFLPLPALPKQPFLTLNTLWIIHMTAEIRTIQIRHFI